MEIIKPGKIRKIKLKCGECPQEGCHNVVEVPNGTPEYIAPANHTAIGTITALGTDTSISLMIDGKYPERFYMGNTGMLIAYKAHDGKLYEQE